MLASLNAVNNYCNLSEENSIKELAENVVISESSNTEKITFSNETMIGALSEYISTPKENFQPMNANFGILLPSDGEKIKDKKKRYERLSKRSLKNLTTEN